MTRIVVIGGGAAGINTTQALAKLLKKSDNAEVIMIEKNPFYYHVVGAPRAYVDPDYTNKMFVPYDDAIPKEAANFVRIVRGVARKISADKNEVSYHVINSDDKENETTETLRFDYLVLATGSTYTVPIKPGHHDLARSATEAKLKEVQWQIERADKILVVGGGAVGCEVSAEIKSKYPNKSVTIVEAKKRLIDRNNLRDKFYVKLSESLEKLGVKVILGERLTERMTANSFEKQTLRTDKGTVIESDIQLLCGGFCPMTTLVQEMDPSLVTERGAVKVGDSLQLEGVKYSNIFALGDMSNHRAPKMGLIAGEQGKFVAGELVAVIQNKQQEFINSFVVPETAGMILPLGPSGGVSQLPLFGGMIVGDWITWMIKSRDYFAGFVWAGLGTKAPK